MKLRNKKSGEVVVEINKIGLVWNRLGMPAEIGQYDSLAELNEEWEDYKPKEPLIKNEKIRKVVRLCASIWGANKILAIKSGSRIEFSDGTPSMRYVSFMHEEWQDGIEDRTYYDIAELCGEEEE